MTIIHGHRDALARHFDHVLADDCTMAVMMVEASCM
jgi:hypothetical protein